MNKQEFIDLVWRLNEILMHSDHLREQIGKCGGECQGFYAIEDEGLCKSCSDIYEAEDDRLDRNKELDKLMKKINKACEEDETGEYQRILDQSRYGEIIH